jgi:hypothetical protein
MVEITEQIVREAPEIEAYKLGLLRSAKDLADRGVQIPPQLVAQLSGLQQSAIGLAERGIGGYQPYLTEAGYTLGDAQTALGGAMASAAPFQAESANLLRSGIAGLGGTTAAFNPAAAQPFMNQYEDVAVQQALSDIARQGQIAQQGVAAQAVGAGAFGGSRSAIAEQELQRNILEQQARTAAQMRAAGFESAAQRAQAAFEAQQGRAQQAAQLTGALGQGIGALGTQYGALGIQQGEALGTLGLRQSALGDLQQQLGQREQSFLFDLGKTQQAQQQAELEAARQSQLQQLYEPYQRLGFLSDIYKGAPSTQQTLAAVTAPTASTAQQILGLGVAGLSAATGASKAGLFG